MRRCAAKARDLGGRIRGPCGCCEWRDSAVAGMERGDLVVTADVANSVATYDAKIAQGKQAGDDLARAHRLSQRRPKYDIALDDQSSQPAEAAESPPDAAPTSTSRRRSKAAASSSTRPMRSRASTSSAACSVRRKSTRARCAHRLHEGWCESRKPRSAPAPPRSARRVRSRWRVHGEAIFPTI